MLCPANIKTGGTELAHQLVFLLRKCGKNAQIAYSESKDGKYIPEEFMQYVTDYLLIEKIPDVESNIVIIPEGMTEYTRVFKKAYIYVWWMSVDNYFHPMGIRRAYDNNGMNQVVKEIIKRVIRKNEPRCTPICEMDNVKLHMVQSKYAEMFLKDNNVANIVYLSDYINDKYMILSDSIQSSKKKNIVLYNPKKGRRFTRQLIKSCRDIKFIPIINMNNEQVIEIMSEAKVYIDFGNHPGKDRMPREAAMLKCCIITGKKGSAKYYEDVSIPDEFKFSDCKKSFKNIREKIYTVFEDYENETKKFDFYREKIKNEKPLFMKQVEDIFVK